MKKLCVVLDGKVIHVGEWESTISYVDKETNILTTIDNPMPDGAIVGEYDITYTSKGSIVLSSDYVELRKNEYPDVT